MITEDRQPPNPNAAARHRGRDAMGARGADRSGAAVPPDPPIVSASADAEAAGTPPDAATRAASPGPGPRTPGAWSPPPAQDNAVTDRPRLAAAWLVLIAVVLLLLVAALLGRP
jgi:hypothetical protein